MPGKMSFCAALVAASLAALAAIQGTSAQKDDCPEELEEHISIIRAPADVNDPDQSVEVRVSDLPRIETQACGVGVVEKICKWKGFKAAGKILQIELNTKAQCLREIPTPTPGTGRFGALAADCNEELIKVLREPSATDDDLSIRVEVDEISEVGRQACGRAAAKEACKTNLRGFATALRLDQNGSFVDGVCSN